MKNLIPCFAILLVFVASAFTTPPSVPVQNTVLPAAVDFYLQIDGVDGESMAEGHRGWIEIQSVSLSEADKTLAIVRKKTSKSSALLQLACAKGTHFKKAVLHIRKSGGDGGTYMKYELKDVLISSYQTSASSSGAPMESMSINFTKIEYR
jgi:type VI secretion system secreted protein Hcp